MRACFLYLNDVINCNFINIYPKEAGFNLARRKTCISARFACSLFTHPPHVKNCSCKLLTYFN